MTFNAVNCICVCNDYSQIVCPCLIDTSYLEATQLLYVLLIFFFYIFSSSFSGFYFLGVHKAHIPISILTCPSDYDKNKDDTIKVDWYGLE